MKELILILMAMTLGACATAPKPEPCPAVNIVKSKDTRKTTGRWIVFNKKNFTTEPGDVLMPQSTKNVFASTLGASDFKKVGDLNAYTFKADPSKVKSFKTKALPPDGDWEIQPEYVHHVLDIVEIKPYACPQPTPCPTCPDQPGPGPGPTPGPIEADASWGRTRVRAKIGMEKVDTSAAKVCVVDTGIDLSHPNRGNVVASASFTGEPVSPDPGQHGTHTAGTVAGTGGVGISRAALYICKGLSNNGSGSSSMLSQCLNWCGQQGAHISSNSWGSTQADPMINSAIAGLTNKGIAVVVANGNDSRGTLNWPAQLSISNPLVFGIAASDSADRKASFSTYGNGTKYIAPGVNIVSNRPGGGTQAMSGTSMATPHVAGLLAFCKVKGIPFQSCLKTDNIGLAPTQQGAGLPRADLTVQ